MAVTSTAAPSTAASAYLDREIGMLLRRLSISGKLKGHQYLIVAIRQVAADPSRLEGITKDLYREIAKHYGATSTGVERAIRTAVSKCWAKGGREALEQIAMTHLNQRPTNSEFIDLLASYFR